MAESKIIIVTGGAGFIGSCLVRELNKLGHEHIVISDHLGSGEKWKNLINLKYMDFIPKDELFERLDGLKGKVDMVFHLGACSSTTEKNADYLLHNNFLYSKWLMDWCMTARARLIYASSGAVYGDGTKGYDDALVEELEPLNMYGYTKKIFDQHVMAVLKNRMLRQCVGLRFFNVYGPNEYHKGQMASVVYHAFGQVQQTGKIRLFASSNPKLRDGEQKRDFVYVRDVVSVMLFMMEHPDCNGIFNVGTGQARSFNELAKAVFSALDKKAKIDYFEMPDELKKKYQDFTRAELGRLRKVGYVKDFYSLEDGVREYVCRYLALGHKGYD